MPMRVFALLVAIAVALVGAVRTPAATAPLPVPKGDFLVCKGKGHLFVMSPKGTTVGTVLATTGLYCPAGLALSADRRSAYCSVLTGDERPPALQKIDLATGAKQEIASGLDPALSPDGAKLAFIATAESPNGGYYTPTGLAILDLASGASRLLAPPPPAAGSHKVSWPAGPLNWSPDGTKIAVFAGDQIRIVDVATAQDLASQPTIPGDVPNHPISKRTYPSGPPPGTSTVAPPPGGLRVITVTTPPPTQTTATSQAPVYLNADTMVVVYDCCTGYSHLSAFNLQNGKRSVFATLYGPPVNIIRIGPGRLLVVTAAKLLVLATRGHTQQLATGISAATG
jgi:WD40-like Beta Propeller Repeat